jgi:hypothetical protein
MAARLVPATTPARRAGTNFTERFDILYPRQRNATQRNTTLDASNLVRDLGGNEPQFRSGWGIIAADAPPHIRRAKPAKNRAFSSCFEAVRRPVQPSDRTNGPEPPRPEKRPELFQLRPWTDPPVLVAAFGLTDPRVERCRYSPARIVVFDAAGGWIRHCDLAARVAPEVMRSAMPSRKQRAQGKPGAHDTRSRAQKCTRQTAGAPEYPAFPARWF